MDIFGDVIGQKKMPSLRAVKCWASMKVRFSTILTRGFLFSRLVPSISVLHCKFACKKDNIQRKLLGPGNLIIIRYKNLSFTDIHCTAKRKIKAKNEFLLCWTKKIIPKALLNNPITQSHLLIVKKAQNHSCWLDSSEETIDCSADFGNLLNSWDF